MNARAADSEGRLVALLQLAHSGELAAALAYGGHRRSVRDAAERDRIREIEEEELHHRAQVAGMLRELGVRPSRLREARAAAIGHVLAALCRVAGWLAPMYGAGRLESRNVREYEVAARLAWACGRHEWLDCLLTMAEVEWDHERYFRERVRSHRLGRRLRLWPKPAPRATIRERFAAETGVAVEAGSSEPWRPTGSAAG
jgi:rubrerythrin